MLCLCWGNECKDDGVIDVLVAGEDLRTTAESTNGE